MLDGPSFRPFPPSFLSSFYLLFPINQSIWVSLYVSIIYLSVIYLSINHLSSSLFSNPPPSLGTHCPPVTWWLTPIHSFQASSWALCFESSDLPNMLSESTTLHLVPHFKMSVSTPLRGRGARGLKPPQHQPKTLEASIAPHFPEAARHILGASRDPRLPVWPLR